MRFMPTQARSEPTRHQPTRTRKPQIEAAKRIVQLAGPRQGARHVALGGTGKGKTWWLRNFAAFAATNHDYVLIHDAKDREPQYEGELYERIGNVVTNPPRGNTLVFRQSTHPESVAKYGWRLADHGKTSLVLIDELYDALSSDMHFAAKGNSAIAHIARKGRSRGVSLVSTTQMPQSLPTVILTQSDTKALFANDSRSLAYLESSLKLSASPGVVETIRTLKVGEFVLIEQGSDWDGVIYGPN